MGFVEFLAASSRREGLLPLTYPFTGVELCMLPVVNTPAKRSRS
jgi:hypothetical protein